MTQVLYGVLATPPSWFRLRKSDTAPPPPRIQFRGGKPYHYSTYAEAEAWAQECNKIAGGEEDWKGTKRSGTKSGWTYSVVEVPQT